MFWCDKHLENTYESMLFNYDKTFLLDLDWCVLLEYFRCDDTLSECEHAMIGFACLLKLSVTLSIGVCFEMSNIICVNIFKNL